METTDGTTDALVVGGTGFVGRHTVEELVEHDYDVTTLARGEHDDPFGDRDEVTFHRADRDDRAALESVRDEVGPEIVIDLCGFRPAQVEAVTDVFADVDAYVFVSSASAYDPDLIRLPTREGDPLCDCTPEQATDDSMASYGPRKAECDREAAAAAERGVTAKTVRPTMVYGPKALQSTDGAATSTGDVASSIGDEAPAWADDLPGLQTHHDYWIDRVNRFDRVVVPGDGTAIWHRAYVEDVASAIRVVAERGEPGEAYNVADRRVCTMEEVIELIAGALGTSVEVVHASERELASVGLDPDDFVLYHRLGSRYPHVLDTCKLASLGWRSTPVERSIERTVAESLASGRDGSAFDPGREAEERLLDTVAE